jgi:hypothetical protein
VVPHEYQAGICDSESTLYYQEHFAKAAMRALESFLFLHANNRSAQLHFVAILSSPSLSSSSMTDENKASTSSLSSSSSLGHQAAIWANEAATTAADEQNSSSNALMSRHAIEVTWRLLALATNMVVPHTRDDGVIQVFFDT